MTPPSLKRQRLPRIIPNAITVTALCTGLSAIRFALLERWEFAVSLILVAAVLDALDGRVARFLRAATPFGAELDSFSDFISFGVAPAVVLYLYTLQSWQGTGWAFVLFFSTCMALRLARFNTTFNTSSAPKVEKAHEFSIGVPAPAGAVLGLFPLILSFALEKNFQDLPLFFAFSLVGSGLLMISRLPTYLLKNVRISPHLVRPLLMMIAVMMAAFYSVPWVTLSCAIILYLLSIPLSFFSYGKKKKSLQRAP